VRLRLGPLLAPVVAMVAVRAAGLDIVSNTRHYSR